MSLLALVAALLFPGITQSLPLNSPLLPSYDYIIVGGGPAGLTVANRLSEDPSVNVLLLEAGPIADDSDPHIDIPGLIGQDIGSAYDWNLSVVAQQSLDGQTRDMPQGRGLGGGTLINGMLWNRGGAADYDAWDRLNGGDSGWGWYDILPYFMKSETFTPVTNTEIAMQYSIEDDASVHGASGPVNVSYPHYFWNTSALFFDALNELGVPTAYDPNSGQVAGASFLPLDLDPETEIRSTAARAYYEPYAARSNLHVSTGQYVTQILFAGTSSDANATVTTLQDDSVGQGSSPGIPGGIFGGTTTNSVSNVVVEEKRNILLRLWKCMKRAITLRQTTPVPASTRLQAIGVEFASSARDPQQNITALREVIVAAGAIHSPQLLMLSGIGPSATLEAQQIPVNVDLPGVGQNLQDHGQVWCYYPFYNASYVNPTMLNDNGTFEADAWIDYWANRTGPLTSGAIGGVAFPSLASVLEDTSSLTDAASSQTAEQYLLSGTAATVVAGFNAQLPFMIEALGDSSRAGFEILNGNTGALTIGNMRPLSRGYVSISSSDPFEPPTIDPRYNSNPIDVQVFLAGIHYNDRLLSTSSLSQMDPEYRNTPSRGASDDELVTYISEKLQTEYHPSGTNAMLPLGLGGVVDPNLLVYGTANVRAVDTSIIPLLPAAHLQAVAYAVAEKAADIIKAANVSPEATTTPAGSSVGESTIQQQPTTAQDSSPQSTTFVTVVATETVYA